MLAYLDSKSRNILYSAEGIVWVLMGDDTPSKIQNKK